MEILDYKLSTYMKQETPDKNMIESCLKKCERVFSDIDNIFLKMGDNDAEQEDTIDFMIYKVGLAKDQITEMQKKIMDMKEVLQEIAPDFES